MANVTKRVENYIYDQIKAKLYAEAREKSDEISKKNDQLKEERKVLVNQVKAVMAEAGLKKAKELGLVAVGYDNLEGLFKYIETDTGSGYGHIPSLAGVLGDGYILNKAPLTTQNAVDNYESRSAFTDVDSSARKMAQKLCIGVELGGKKLADIEQMIEDVLKDREEDK